MSASGALAQVSTVSVDSRCCGSSGLCSKQQQHFLKVSKEWNFMSFGSEMGGYLTTSDEFRADLIIDDQETIPIDFNSFQLTYKKGESFFIHLGLVNDSGQKNELTLSGTVLASGMTYPISPVFKGVAARFALANYTQSLPADYSGMFNVESVNTSEYGVTTVTGSFSIYFQDAGKDLEVRCQTLKVST
ncbi:hypothetical protein [Pseudomonas sp. L1(2025)]|uniref:hypothetical protein n=1 Tax=Pseudomonas sp. L1(2025) TaxID=3449429 RepID=UPI003F6902FE